MHAQRERERAVCNINAVNKNLGKSRIKKI